jgi:hypothetical protein
MCVCVCVVFFAIILRHTHSVGLLWTSDRPVSETSTQQHTTLTKERHPCSGGIQTQHIYALDCAAAGIGRYVLHSIIYARTNYDE